MLRTTTAGPIVLLEGITDGRLYPRFFLPRPHVRSVFCDGKPNALGAMQELRRRRVSGVLAVCDADYDRIIDIPRGGDIYYADHHDAETMICFSSAFHRVYEELVDREASLEESQAVRDALVEVACEIGEIRLWSAQNQASLKFSNVNPGNHLRHDRSFDLESYVSQILEDSQSSNSEFSVLVSLARARNYRSAGIEVASGHDVCSLLSKEIEYQTSDAPPSSQIEAMLRLGFDAECFAQTELARELNKWQERNELDLLADAALPLGA
ncbi:DUF4435 domain-containing protein [Streptomyces sp. NPDC093223]|uniref:DUF4435 domain-containing protein n=1 Tax=Streptomyces sp. NPDC093223 TaxID=3366033 RepID=UPI00380D5C68